MVYTALSRSEAFLVDLQARAGSKRFAVTKEGPDSASLAAPCRYIIMHCGNFTLAAFCSDITSLATKWISVYPTLFCKVYGGRLC